MEKILKMLGKSLSIRPPKSLSRIFYPKIAIFGQYKTGTTACFFKLRNSMKQTPLELFEQPEYRTDPQEYYKPVLAKVIVPPNPYKYTTSASPSDSLQELTIKADQGLMTFDIFDKRVYLVRDPRDWIVSGTLFVTQERPEVYNDDNMLSKVLSILRRKEENPPSVSLLDILSQIYPNKNVEEFVSQVIKDHHSRLLQFEKSLQNFVIWRYEDMINNQSSHVEQYLGFKLTGESTPDKKFEHVARTKSSGNWRHWFTPEDVDFFRPLFSAYIKRHGYEQNWDLDPAPQINPVHASVYVERVVHLKRTKEKNSASD